MVWAVPLNQPVLANVASFTSSLSALYSLPLLSRHPSVRVCPLATAIPSAARQGHVPLIHRGFIAFFPKQSQIYPLLTLHETVISPYTLPPWARGFLRPPLETRRRNGVQCPGQAAELATPPACWDSQPKMNQTHPSTTPLSLQKEVLLAVGPSVYLERLQGLELSW